MTATADMSALPPRWRRFLIPLAVVGILAAGFLVVRTLTNGDDGGTGKVKGSSGRSFTLSYPDGWSALGQDQLQNLPGKPLAVVRQDDAKGYVVLREEKRAPANSQAFTSELTTELAKRVPDFEKQSSRIIQTKAGKAFYFSYIRKKRGTVHTVVIVPAGKRSYTLNTVSQGGEKAVARDIANMILSFKD